MKTLILLHDANPLMVWLAFGALLISASLASGNGRLVWPALAAALTGVLAAGGLRGPAEPAVFVLSLGLGAAVFLQRKSALRKPSAGTASTGPVVVIGPATRTPAADAPSEEPRLPVERETELERAPLRRFGG